MKAEEPVLIGPRVPWPPSGAARQRSESVDRVFMRVLGVNALAFDEAKLVPEDANGLARQTHEMHLDTAFGVVIDRIMGETPDIDVAAELAIDAFEQIEVEGGGDAAAIVVGRDQDCRVLLQINADEKCGPPAQEPRGVDQEGLGFRVGEIADGRAGKEAEL